MWCGELACEEKLKEEVGVSSRCMPFEQEHLADECICCGKKRNKWCIGEKRINALLGRKDEKDFRLHNKMQSKVLFSFNLFHVFLRWKDMFLFCVLRRMNSNIPIRNVESPIKIDAG